MSDSEPKLSLWYKVCIKHMMLPIKGVQGRGGEGGGSTCCCSGEEPGIGRVEDIQDAVHHVWHQGRPSQL